MRARVRERAKERERERVRATERMSERERDRARERKTYRQKVGFPTFAMQDRVFAAAAQCTLRTMWALRRLVCLHRQSTTPAPYPHLFRCPVLHLLRDLLRPLRVCSSRPPCSHNQAACSALVLLLHNLSMRVNADVYSELLIHNAPRVYKCMGLITRTHVLLRVIHAPS